MASNPADDFIFLEAPITNSGIKKKKSGLNSWPSIEYLIWSMYITALDVTSAPDPAVVGIATNFANFLLILYEEFNISFLRFSLSVNTFAIFA